ncbi:MAG TPA: type II secretion system protein GspH [Chromatiaceae bacterium]|nr:type II secretion system protein GspH [Chromatiaceae bacterium]
MGQRGFTLLELIVVLAIAAVMMTVVPPLISSALPGAQLKSAARQVAAGLRVARNQALVQRRESSLVIDLEKRDFRVSGRPRSYSIPDSLKIELLTAESERLSERRAGIRFFPAGGSTGGRITLSSGKRALGVDVDWLTGKVRILELRPES